MTTISNTVLWIVFACLSVFAGAPLGIDLFWIAVSALFGVYLLAVLTNWHGWGQRVWEFRLGKPPRLPPYRQPRDPRLRLLALTVAMLALLSDVVLLIVLLSR